AQMPDAVDETESHGLTAGPEGAGEKLGFVAAQFAAAAAAHQRLEILMHVALQVLQALDVFRLLGLEGVEHRLRFARGVHAPLDAELLDRVDKAEARGDDANRADDRARIGIDLSGRTSEPIAARSRQILAEGEDGDVLLIGES